MTKIKRSADLVSVNRTDRTGKCLISDDGHYYRQEKNRVLHVHDEIVNILPDDKIEDSRVNWDHTFEEIDPDVFETKLQEVLNSFFS